MKRALPLLLLLGCAHALPVGAPFPPLQVRTLEGAPVDLRDLRGPALVDLWATWCIPCAHALPFYQRLAKETGIEVIAISIDAEDAPVREWLLRHPVSFRILRDPDGAVAEELGMRLMPTSFLIDARGMVRVRHDGFRDEDEPAIEAEVRSLLADTAPHSSSLSRLRRPRLARQAAHCFEQRGQRTGSGDHAPGHDLGGKMSDER